VPPRCVVEHGTRDEGRVHHPYSPTAAVIIVEPEGVVDTIPEQIVNVPPLAIAPPGSRFLILAVELASSFYLRSDKHLELTFRALLMENGAKRLELARA
jgi:hypothetical protein